MIEFKEKSCKEALEEQKNLENFKYIQDSRLEELQNDKDNTIQLIKDKEGELGKMFD